MRAGLPVALTLATLFQTGCPRPKEAAETDWRRHPGLDPRPAERVENIIEGAHVAAAAPATTPSNSEAVDNGLGQELEDAAIRGENWALIVMGRKLMASGADAGQVRQGVALMRKAADQGDPAAQFEVAMMYAEGRGVVKDMNLAIVWAGKAADQGHAEAQFALGRALVESGTPEQKAEGMVYMQKAAEAGNRQSVLFLAAIYAFGRFEQTKDEARAESLLKPGAEDGDSDCQLLLASIYASSETFTAKRGEAELWLRRSAEQGNTQAIQLLQSRGSKN